jgi:hypothetical protein
MSFPIPERRCTALSIWSEHSARISAVNFTAKRGNLLINVVIKLSDNAGLLFLIGPNQFAPHFCQSVLVNTSLSVLAENDREDAARRSSAGTLAMENDMNANSTLRSVLACRSMRSWFYSSGTSDKMAEIASSWAFDAPVTNPEAWAVCPLGFESPP